VASPLGFGFFALRVLQQLKRQRPLLVMCLAGTRATYAVPLELTFLSLGRHCDGKGKQSSREGDGDGSMLALVWQCLGRQHSVADDGNE
jgi:hypothetical protein